jgi:NifB/MoaA-like Fe-S oxidoreductase
MSENEIRRIIDMRLGPINVSIHTTDPDLRVRMLSNRRAGEALRFLYMLAEAGIRLNGQIVLCPGYNDEAALEKTLTDLTALRPALESVSVVPVGMTRFREHLAELRPVTPEGARAVLDTVGQFAARCREGGGGSLFFCSDEFYLLAGRDFPSIDHYEDFPQFENGVGMAPLFLSDFSDRLE